MTGSQNVGWRMVWTSPQTSTSRFACEPLWPPPQTGRSKSRGATMTRDDALLPLRGRLARAIGRQGEQDARRAVTQFRTGRTPRGSLRLHSAVSP